MKGFRKTGNGPKSGFTFSSKAGFGPSSGKVKNISGYSRRAPKRRAVGGLVKDNIVEAPGFSDYAGGGKVSANDVRKKLGAQFTQREFDYVNKHGTTAGMKSPRKPTMKAGPRDTVPIRRAKGGRVPGVSDPMSARQALDHFSKGGKVGLAAKALARKGYAKHLQKKGAAKNSRENSIVVDGETLWDDPNDSGIRGEFKKLKSSRKY